MAIPTRPSLNPLDHLAHWRKQLFNTVLTIVLVLGLLTAIPSVMLLGGNTLVVLALDGAALIWVASLRLAQGVAYRTRVLQFLAMNLMFGCGLMVTVGPSSQSYLAAGPMMAALLLGTGEALAVTLIGTVTIFIILCHARLPTTLYMFSVNLMNLPAIAFGNWFPALMSILNRPGIQKITVRIL